MSAKCKQSTNWIYQQTPELCELDHGASVDDMDIVGNQAMTDRLKMSSEENSDSILDAYEANTAEQKTGRAKFNAHFDTLKALPDPVAEALYAHDGTNVIHFEGYSSDPHEFHTYWEHGGVAGVPMEYKVQVMERVVQCGREMSEYYWDWQDREDTLQEMQESLLDVFDRMMNRIHTLCDRYQDLYGVLEEDKIWAALTNFFASDIATPLQEVPDYISSAYANANAFRDAVWEGGNVYDSAITVEISIQQAAGKIDELVNSISSGSDTMVFALSAVEKVSLSIFTAWATGGMSLAEQILMEATMATALNGIKQGAELQAETRNEFDVKEMFGEGVKSAGSKLYTEVGAGGMKEMIKDYEVSEQVLKWVADPASKALMGQIFEEAWNEQTGGERSPDMKTFSKALAGKLVDEYKGKAIEKMLPPAGPEQGSGEE